MTDHTLFSKGRARLSLTQAGNRFALNLSSEGMDCQTEYNISINELIKIALNILNFTGDYNASETYSQTTNFLENEKDRW